jgi:outer membrane protein OmpA-like peptidoglycan-associated protein
MTATMKAIIASVLCLSLLFMGCGASNTVKGGAIGAAAGGVLGAVIGKQAGNTALGAILGAAIGGTAGALIGKSMDNAAEELRNDLKNAKIERVGEGIKITFDSGILFETAKSTLQPTAKTNIADLSRVLQKYPDTNILVTGHTDSDGSDDYNKKLSEDRATSVSDYMKTMGIATARITPVGLGETEPVATNDTPANKQLNRRVEIAIFANDKMKKAAENGELN